MFMFFIFGFLFINYRFGFGNYKAAQTEIQTAVNMEQWLQNPNNSSTEKEGSWSPLAYLADFKIPVIIGILNVIYEPHHFLQH